MACGLPVIHTGTGPTNEFVPEDGGWAVPAERAPLRSSNGLPELVADGFVHEVKVDALAATLREVAAQPDERRRRGAVSLERAREYSWDRVAEIAERSLGLLHAEQLPLARAIGVAQLERREELAIYAPDWSDEESWGQTLERWASAFGGEDPVTLALYLPDQDPGEAGRAHPLAPAGGAACARRTCPTWRCASPIPRASPAWWRRPTWCSVDPLVQPTGRSSRAGARRVLVAVPEELLDYAAALRRSPVGT